ncbi:thioredoxin family protein [Domibacillus mangrovi]|uniref:Thioredoxin domain-containing protein n=1 Tax=Domibacillus mangrovi TaxID=1714354 RepID=A0A1Q5P1M1_9BACI|nr:thioredoxin family protein [Domibacillus mangrovi]OKL36012.1 hypothetical protein BLL40_11815 [Domibacillus mangrovi]
MYMISSYAEFSDVLSSNEAILLYISSPRCSVCHALLPQVETLMTEFSAVTVIHANTAATPEITGQLMVFSAPAILFFIYGKERFRMARFVPIDMLRENITNALKIV